MFKLAPFVKKGVFSYSGIFFYLNIYIFVMIIVKITYFLKVNDIEDILIICLWNTICNALQFCAPV